MRKNFFKKLSFVLALAMIISVIAPAAGAFAASAPKLNATKKYLHLDVDGSNDFNFNITRKQTGWKYLWSSANENVAEVNGANGVVTATGVGTTKISVVITDDGEEVDELKATVVVRDNIAELTSLYIQGSTPPAVDKLAVGTVYDFGRKFKTVSGSTTKTGAVTRWSVDKTTATIGDSGKFTATEAGTYVITARSFQSAAKYASWLVDSTLDYVLATKTIEVTVVASMVEAKQLTFTTAQITFDSDMSKVLTKDNLKAYRVITGVGQPIDLLVKKVSFDTTGKIVTVEMFVDFIGGENYKFVYGTLEKAFVAAKAEVDAVKSVVLTTTEAVYTDGQKTLEAKLYNAEGVDITTTTLLARVDYAITNNVGYINGDKLILFAKGDVANVKVTFHTYKYDTAYQEIVVTGSGNVVAVDTTTYNLGSTVDLTLATSNPDWSKAKVASLAAGDTGYSVFARVKSTKTTADEYYYSYAAGSGINDGKFSFTSSNQEVLIVDKTGIVYPVKAGAAIIIVSYDNKAVATLAVEVKTARSAVEFSLEKNAVTVSNSSSVAAVEEIKLTLKDELGANFFDNSGYAASKVTITPLKSNPDLGVGNGPLSFKDATNKVLVVTGAAATKGTWTYQIKAYDKVAILVVTVEEPTNATVVYYKLTLDKTTVDRALATDSAIKSVTPTLTGYGSNGVANFKSTWADGFTYTVTKTDATVYGGASLTDGIIEVTTAGATITSPTSAVSGTAIVAIDKDITYVVTAYQGAVVKGTATFTVTDSKATATYTYEKAETTLTTNSILEAVKDCFKVTLSGTDIADTELYSVNYVVGNTAAVTDTLNTATVADGTVVLVKSVKFIKTFTAGGVTYASEYTVDINRTITVK